MKQVLLIFLFSLNAFSQVSNGIQDVNILSGSVTLSGSSAVTQSGLWSTGRTWSLLSSTDSTSAWLKDGNGNSVTSSVAGAARPLDVQLHNSSGNPFGTNANPLRVDPTGTTSQPVLIATLPSLAAGTNAIGSITNTSFGISGTLPAFAATPTFNLGTLNGAALDTSVNSLLKPASTLAAVTTVGTVTSITNPVTVTGALTDTQLRASAVPVSLASTTISNFPATQAISAASLPLPTGAATAANQASQTTILNTIATNTGTASTDTIASGTITALNGTVVVNAQGAYTVSASITGTYSATLVAEGQDAANNWNQLPMYIVQTTTPYPQTLTITTPSVVLITGGGYANIRIRSSVFTSGTVNVALNASLAQQTIFSAQLGSWSTRLQDGSGNAIASIDDGNGTKALEVAQGATSFVFSAVNSSTVQLAAAATFNGTVETVTNQQSASILLTTDQNGTLVLREYIDAAGLRQSRVSTYTIVANVPFSRSFVLNGNYFRAAFTNNGGATTTTFNLNTAYGTIPSATALGNGQVSLDEINGTAFVGATKGVQPALALPTQNLIDSGRVKKIFSATFTAATTEALVTLTPITDGVAGTTGTSFSVTAGKRFRLQSACIITRNAGAAAQGVVIQVRQTSTGAITTTSPLIGTVAAGTGIAVANVSAANCYTFADGIEFSGTEQFGVSQVGSATANNTVVLTGFEY